MKPIAMVGLVALSAAACSDHVQIGSTLIQAVEGVDGAIADAAPAAPAEAGAFVAFTYAMTSTLCGTGPQCSEKWSVNAAGTLTCPDKRTVHVAESDLDAFLAIALRPDVLAALSQAGPCSDASDSELSTEVTLELGATAPLAKDIALCGFDPYDSLITAAKTFRSAHCDDAP